MANKFQNIENSIGMFLYCIKSDKSFGLEKGKFYKIIDIQNKLNINFYIIEGTKVDGMKEGTKYFLSVLDSHKKLRYRKFNRIFEDVEE